ncbi:MAG: transposase [Dehalococcoidia bacterium]|nr:transposase [Dehalococcoidia bacterium]
MKGEWVESQQVSTWFWVTSIPQKLIPSDQLCQIGHERWKIENSIFNNLSQNWSLDHCLHHQPKAILNFILILFIAHILLTCFRCLNMKPSARKIYSTLIAVAIEILNGVKEVKAKNIPWRQARGSPKAKA